MKYLHLHNIRIYLNFHQNQFINECAGKIKAKIPVSQFHSFFVRCRRTYVLNNHKDTDSENIFENY